MRFLILFFVVACIPAITSAQKQGNIWLFGNKLGLNFNTVPVSSFADSTRLGEGPAMISDGSGRLLFYTDGEKIYHSRRDTMVNGTGIGGSSSSTQSSIILPKPGSPVTSTFYVFTSDHQEGYYSVPGQKVLGYNYSVVDLCSGSSGRDTLGAVVTGQKNIHLVDSGSEKLCATADGDGGYWVLGHTMPGDSFVAWRLSASGVSAPVFSRIGPKIGQKSGNITIGGRGQIKFNPASTRVAMATPYDAAGTSATLDLFDFDLRTGKLSNHCKTALGPAVSGSYSNTYGVEFSPDGSKVYITFLGGGLMQVLRYSQGGACAGVIASKDTVFERSTMTTVSGTLTGIQAAPDGNLYVAYFSNSLKKNELHRISNPNGASAYDTTAFVFPITGTQGYPVYLPCFVSGFKYHNTLRNCQKTVVAGSTLSGGEVRVSPNPADAFVTFTGADSAGTEPSRVTITDAAGRRIATDEKLPARIELSSQPAGLYFYRVHSESGAETSGKLLVTH